MAGRVIGRLPVVYDPATRRVEVESAGEFVETQLFQRLDELAKDKPLRLTLTVEPEHHKRSTAQNSLMWALLTIMADHCCGVVFQSQQHRNIPRQAAQTGACRQLAFIRV